MAEEKLFKELEIGFREIFRILIPGAYFLGLAKVIAPDSSFTNMMTNSTASGLVAIFFMRHKLEGAQYEVIAHQLYGQVIFEAKLRTAPNAEAADREE
jgi:hypothetical protein